MFISRKTESQIKAETRKRLYEEGFRNLKREFIEQASRINNDMREKGRIMENAIMSEDIGNLRYLLFSKCEALSIAGKILEKCTSFAREHLERSNIDKVSLLSTIYEKMIIHIIRNKPPSFKLWQISNCEKYKIYAELAERNMLEIRGLKIGYMEAEREKLKKNLEMSIVMLEKLRK